MYDKTLDDLEREAISFGFIISVGIGMLLTLAIMFLLRNFSTSFFLGMVILNITLVLFVYVVILVIMDFLALRIVELSNNFK